VPRQKTSRPRTTRWSRGRYAPRRKVCFFCANKNEAIDYKDSDKLRNYVSDRGKIEPRRRTGICAKHQRALTVAIKRARHLAMLPYVSAHARRAQATETVDAE
jgi:small subunit ribosomal protein S18